MWRLWCSFSTTSRHDQPKAINLLPTTNKVPSICISWTTGWTKVKWLSLCSKGNEEDSSGSTMKKEKLSWKKHDAFDIHVNLVSRFILSPICKLKMELSEETFNFHNLSQITTLSAFFPFMSRIFTGRILERKFENGLESMSYKEGKHNSQSPS